MSYVLVLIFAIDIGIVVVAFLVTSGLKKYIIEKKSTPYNERAVSINELPSISLCITARNENHALTDCLMNAIASDYQKLEIIVLDDCSQDKTSEVIKSFAHEGVRFVQGEVPSEGWLGKNNAYQALAREANGSYIFFMSVDTRIEKDTLSKLVNYMQLKKLSMTSVLPLRDDGVKLSVVFCPLRYFWQVITPLNLNTPTATSLWAIRQDALEAAGGFVQFKNAISPESILANLFVSTHKYRFLIADEYIGVRYAKKWSSQVETGIRLWYPTLGKNLLSVVAMMLLHATLFVLPYGYLLYVLFTDRSLVVIMLALVTVLALSLLYTAYARYTQKKTWVFGPFVLPLIAMQEIIIISASYYQYKRGKVNWKGRNICYPVLNRSFK